MPSIKQKATQTAKRAGLLTGGAIFCAIGLGFLTLAAWFFLSVTFSPLEAALILAAAYFGVGLLLIGLGRSGSAPAEPVAKATPDVPPDMPPLMQAVMVGIQAGLNASGNKR